MNMYAPQLPASTTASELQKRLGLLGFWGCGHGDLRDGVYAWCRRCGLWEGGRQLTRHATDEQLRGLLTAAVGQTVLVQPPIAFSAAVYVDAVEPA